jgi:hypothetical protein
MNEHDTPRPTDDAFDRALRARHEVALRSLSARTQAQLHKRQHAAVAASRAYRSGRAAWALAAACSLVLVLGVGVRLRPGDGGVSSRVPASVSIVDGANDGGELVATLDEAPDLYLWLASDDAAALAME